MDIKEKTTVSPPNDETDYELKVIDYGQGNHQLSLAPNGDAANTYNFSITNLKLQECQWRDEDDPLPTPVLRAAEYYGYHVTDVTRRPTHGLYENVSYLQEAVERTRDELHDGDLLSEAALNWSSESLDSLEKLELLRAHLTEAEFDIVLYKAQETSRNHPSGNLTLPLADGTTTDASLKSVVMLMLAYAQHDGFLDRTIVPPDAVERLVRRPPHA
jgi:hypothetical protein